VGRRLNGPTGITDLRGHSATRSSTAFASWTRLPAPPVSLFTLVRGLGAGDAKHWSAGLRRAALRYRRQRGSRAGELSLSRASAASAGLSPSSWDHTWLARGSLPRQAIARQKGLRRMAARPESRPARYHCSL